MVYTRSRAARLTPEHSSSPDIPDPTSPAPADCHEANSDSPKASASAARDDTSAPPPGDVESRSPSPSPSPESKQVRNARNPKWAPWQDRFLAAEALKHRPFLEARGAPIQAAWDSLATSMGEDSAREGTVITRTGSACRARFKVLMDAFDVCGVSLSLFVLLLINGLQKDEARSLQKTGTNKEVNDHIEVSNQTLLMFQAN
jgi:hypothetical protein